MVADLTIKNTIDVSYMLSPLITRLGPTLTSFKLFKFKLLACLKREQGVSSNSELTHPTDGNVQSVTT
jgi:hypothetical protein